MDFKDFNFNPDLLEGLLAMGFRNATPIQTAAIPLILDKKDLIACAQTGTGKTGAYLLPIMNMISMTENRHNNTLILAPTRELAQQIDLQVEALSYFTNISSLTVYGGGDGIAYEQQKRSMREGVDIIIATPGRLISHLSSGLLKLDQLQHLVLDEADRMLDMGFYDDIMRIVSFLPKKRQTVLFSATMPPKIRTLAGRLLHNPEQISIAISKPAAGINQQAYLVHDSQKVKLLTELMKNVEFPSILIFASTKEKVKNLGKVFRGLGFKAEAFHSDLGQKEREAILSEFKNKRVPVLIGTDVLSRGIDVEGISLVINFDVPHDPEDYIHRIGRTARAATTGTAITLVNEKDKRKFANIEKLIDKTIDRMPLPEHFGEVPADAPDGFAGEKKHDRKKPQQRKVWGKKPRGKSSGTSAARGSERGSESPAGSGTAVTGSSETSGAANGATITASIPSSTNTTATSNPVKETSAKTNTRVKTNTTSAAGTASPDSGAASPTKE